MKLLIQYQTKLYRFLDIQHQKDGSIYISLDRHVREPASRLVKKANETVYNPAPAPTNSRKLSYHTTGRVNYHGLVSSPPSYFEPLVDISVANTVLAISIPSCTLLDIYEGGMVNETADYIIPINHENRFTFAVTFTPTSFSELEGVRFDFRDFSLWLHPILHDLSPPTPLHFVYAAPQQHFTNQRIGKNEAELAYVQGRGNSEIIIDGPNQLGHYTMYFAVVMRVAPNVRVELTDPNHRFQLQDNTKPHKLTFSIRGKSDLVRETNLRPFIQSIELDAEL